MNTKLLAQVREDAPRIHCITNYVTVHEVANMILAAGAAPIMADCPLEAEEITGISQALVLNLGTLNESRLEAMKKAAAEAARRKHPIVLDPVGAGASAFRTNAALSLTGFLGAGVIRGNASEIRALARGCANSGGVDAEKSDRIGPGNLENFLAAARRLNQMTGAAVVVTGETDLVVDRERCYLVGNGDPMMSRITGAGCMLDGVIAAFLAAAGKLGVSFGEAAALAAAAHGLCGEIAASRAKKESGGTASFGIYLIDAMSGLTEDCLRGGAKIEIR